MKIYARTGDGGSTGLFGGARVPKSHPRVATYGTLDEANAAIGLARSFGLPASIDAVLARVQGDLFRAGAELACVPGKESNLRMSLLEPSDAQSLEEAIDRAEQELPPLQTFILPGGTPAASALHLARTVVRRAERHAVRIAKKREVRSELIVYLNRLSDLLFVFARFANHDAKREDIPWQPR